MYTYWDQKFIDERIETLRRQADQRRLAATARRSPANPRSTRLHQRLAALLAPLGAQPQPCTC